MKWKHVLVTSRFPSQRGSDAELWCFRWCEPVQSVAQTFERQVNEDVLLVIWRRCNVHPNHKKILNRGQQCILTYIENIQNPVDEIKFCGAFLQMKDVILHSEIQSREINWWLPCHKLILANITLTKGQFYGLWCFFDVGPHKVLNKQSNGRWFKITWHSFDVIAS